MAEENDELTRVAAQLYVLPREEFTAARNDRAKAAKSAGDKKLATALGKLAKPSPAAWAVNLLVRAQPQQVEDLLNLGDQLREAHASASPDVLRQLSAQRSRVVAALAEQARTEAAAVGGVVREDALDEVRSTLTAALADPEAAASVRAGTLTTALTYAGLGGLSFPPPALPKVVDEPGATSAHPTTGPSEELRQALVDAEAAATRAADTHAQRRAEADEASAQVTEAHTRVQELRDQLRQAESDEAETKQRLKEAERSSAKAARALQPARQTVAKARAKVEAAGAA